MYSYSAANDVYEGVRRERTRLYNLRSPSNLLNYNKLPIPQLNKGLGQALKYLCRLIRAGKREEAKKSSFYKRLKLDNWNPANPYPKLRDFV